MEVPALEYLLETFFHQDFQEVYGSVWDTVDTFIKKYPDLALDVPREVDLVLVSMPTEAEVQDFVMSTGCEYLPQPDDHGYRGWLIEVAHRVAAAVSGAGPA